MKETIETLEKDLEALDNQWLQVVESMPDSEMKQELLRVRTETIEKRKEKRRLDEELIKKCHPTDDHWPPHEDCPICQKVFQKLENEARTALGEEDSKDAKKLEQKVCEIFEKKYLKGPTDGSTRGSEQGQS